MSDTIRENVKRRLHAYTDRKHELEQLNLQLQQLESTMTSPRAQALDGMPRGSSGGDAVTGLVAELTALQTSYQDKMRQLIVAQTEVEQIIDRLEPVERQLMRCRYIDDNPWEVVCVIMNYSWRQAHRIHGRVLDKLVAAEMEKEV